MGMTPLDAEKFEFPSGFRGYDRNQVEQFRAAVVQALEGHIREAGQLRQRIKDLEEKLSGFKDNEDLIRNSMMLAQKTGEDVVANAREEAEMIKARALADCQDIRNELARLKAEREEFEYSFHGLLSGFMRRLEQNNTRLGADSQPTAEASGTPAEPAAAVPPPAISPPVIEEPQAEPESRWTSEPEPAQLPLERQAELDRDADIADFRRALSSAPPEYDPHAYPTPAPEPEPAQAAEAETAPPASAEPPAAVNDEMNTGEAVELEDEPKPAGLEEIEGLQPPPAVQASEPQQPQADDNWESTPSQPVLNTESSLSSRLQPSRSVEAGAEPAAPEPGPTQQEADDEAARRELPPSNLDQVFGGLPSTDAADEESDEESPYRADW